MIAVDTSALITVVLDQPGAASCIAALKSADGLLMSAGTLAEVMIVAARRDVSDEIAELIEHLGLRIVPVTPAAAKRVALAYEKWGKGIHPAGLNFGDCFAYEVAKHHRCPLLYIGRDFARTDIESVI